MNYNNLNYAWCEIADKVLRQGNKVRDTRELSNVSFTIEDIGKNVLSCRHMFSPHYYLGEMIWYGAGANDVRFISKFGKVWEFLSDDSLTNNSAYGYILKYKHGFDQVDKIVELLKKDPSSRRAVININVPNANVIETKDEMCTIALQFLLRDGKLNATGIMRSNDLWTGTPYDIFYFTTIQKYVAKKLGVGYGTYTHFVTSLHVYNRDIDKVARSIDIFDNEEFDNVWIDGLDLLKNGLKYYKMFENVPKEEIKEKIVEFAKDENLIVFSEL